MMNMSIACQVKNCKHNHEVERYCTLESIQVTENKRETSNGPECANFEACTN